MLCFPWRAPPRLQKHPTPNSTQLPTTHPSSRNATRCLRAALRPGAGRHTHTGPVRRLQRLHLPPAFAHPFPTSHSRHTARKRARRRTVGWPKTRPHPPRQLKLTPRHRERIPRGSNGAIQKPSGCNCLIWAQRFRFLSAWVSKTFSRPPSCDLPFIHKTFQTTLPSSQ